MNFSKDQYNFESPSNNVGPMLFDSKFSSVNSKSYQTNNRQLLEFNTETDNFKYNISYGLMAMKISQLITYIPESDRKTIDKNQKILAETTSEYQDMSLNREDCLFMDKNSIKAIKKRPIWINYNDSSLQLFSTKPFSDFKTEWISPGFQSALSILLLKPQLITRLFETQSDSLNTYGIYGLWINNIGKWQLNLLDSYFPTLDNFYLYTETKDKINCIFHYLLEKELVLKYNTYENTKNLPTINIIHDFTGLSYKKKDLNDLDDDNLWGILSDAINTESLIYVQSENENDITHSHSNFGFAILGKYDIDYEENKTTKLIKLLAPNSSLILDGKWRKNSFLWTNDLKEFVRMNKDPINSFYLDIFELRNYFKDIYSIKSNITTNDQYTWIEMNNSTNSIVKLQLTSQANITIGVHFKNNSEYSYVRILIAKQTNSKYEFIAGNYSNNRDNFVDINDIESGTYLVSVEILWYNDYIGDFTLSCLSNTYQNDFRLVNMSDYYNENKFLEFQKNIMKDFALRGQSESQRIRDYSSMEETDIKIYNDMIYGFLYFYYVNKSPKKLIENITMSKTQNLNICYPFASNKTIDITLNPDEEIIILFKYDKKGKDFSYALSIKASLEANNYISSSQINYLGESKERIKSSKINSGEIVDSVLLNSGQMRKEHKKLLSSEYVGCKGNLEENLINCLIEHGKRSQRKIDNKEIKVSIYKFLHEEGIAILYLNEESNNYKERIEIKQHTNLDISQADKDKIIQFTIKPKQHYLLLMSKIDQKQGYQYKFESQYSLEKNNK